MKQSVTSTGGDIFNPGIKQEADVRNILRHFRIDYGDGIISEH